MPPIIHKENAHLYVVAPVINGERKAFGGIPRNYATHPRGCYESVKAIDFPLIPQADWSALCKQKTEEGSWLGDIRLKGMGGQPIPSRDQNGRGYCHTADTECLTENGWVPWSEYDYSSLLATVNPLTGKMEFQAPFECHVYEYDGEMVYSTNRRVDFGVTPDHRMMVRKWDERRRTLSNEYTFQRAGEIGWYAGLMHAPGGFIGTELERLGIDGDREYLGDDLIALAAVVASDGYAGGTENTENQVSFCCFREDRYPLIAALAHRVGFKEQPERKGVWTRYGAGALAAWMRANCYNGQGLKSVNKRVPELVKWASTRQILHFLKYFGDKNHGNDAQQVYYSSSKRMMDDIQELLLRTGQRGTLCSRGPRHAVMKDGKEIDSSESFTLYVAKEDNLCLDRKKHIERDHYKGLVYCAAVPNGTLITRRNGSVLISGNCWAHSGVSACLLLRCAGNMPYADLSAYAVACIIKSYADEGGWGAEGLDFLTTRGCPTSEFWPQRSVDRANDRPETWADAALHKVTEGWIDLVAQQYDRTMSFAQRATLWLSDGPTIDDFNWWSHSVCGCKLVEGATMRHETRMSNGKLATLQQFDDLWDVNGPTAGFGCMIWNSWSDSWGELGMGVLAGSHAQADGCTAPRVVG